jgi:hypothetical protein
MSQSSEASTSTSTTGQPNDDDPILGFDDTEDITDINLNYQPTVIKCRNGDRIWHAINDRTCVQMCKSQLRVC